MSVQSQITRLKNNVAASLQAVAAKGVAVSEDATSDDLPSLIAEIVSGSYQDSTPIEISTDAGMEAVLTSDNVGKVYKFTGTSDTYTNGDLYIVEAG